MVPPLTRADVEELLGEFLETDRLRADEDGDIPVSWGPSLLFARIIDAPLRIRLSCTVLHGVSDTLPVLQAINALNAEVVGGRVYWDDGQVVAATEVGAPLLHRTALDTACATVSTLADTLDARLGEALGSGSPELRTFDPG